MTTATVPATGEPEGLRDRRRRLVASEIERVALDLFAERGYGSVTTDDIALACGMSVRTFFRYFNAKRDVLLAMPRRSVALLCDLVAGRPEGEPLLDSWRQAAIVAIDRDDIELIPRMKTIVLGDPDLVELINGDAELTERFVQTSADRLGVAADHLVPVVLGGAVRHALIAAMDQWSSGRRADLARSFDRSFDVLATLGAVAPPARRRPARR